MKLSIKPSIKPFIKSSKQHPNILSKALLASVLLLTTAASQAEYYGYSGKTYKVSITNVTKGVLFTPVLISTHSKRVALFEVGEAPSDELASLAEGGDIAPLMESLLASPNVTSAIGSTGPLPAGETVELVINGQGRNVLSLSAMLLPTNDTFVGLDAVRLPRYGSITYYARAYDAGSETNDEQCISIPGPQCGGEPFSPNDAGEGYVYPSPGLHGEGDLSLASYNWQGAVAKVVVTRIWQ